MNYGKQPKGYMGSFWAKVKMTETCWPWMGAMQNLSTGKTLLYGKIQFQKKMQSAHRVSWQLANGKSIPKYRFILHKCNNSKCVRPSHLYVGTRSDNQKDRYEKNRWAADLSKSKRRYSMERKIGALTFVVAVAFAVPSLALATCPRGTVEFSGGCAAMPSAEESTLAPMVPTSTEKPPSDKMLSYERENVHASTQDSLIASDIKADREHMQANIEGKKKARTPLTEEEKAFDEANKK